MRRSISLSPIRTESGANLRTANWTRLKFRNPHQQQHQQHQNYRNYNNHGNYQHYNNRGYNNNRFQNRGRGYYRNQNFTTTRYIPRRRYNSNRRDDSRSRSRSYSRSVSRDRSRSRNKYSRSPSPSASGSERSNSNDRGHSPSYSPESKETKKSKNVIKTEAATYYSSTQAEKSDMEFPEKVATDLSRWGSPGGTNPTFQSSSNKKMQEALTKNVDPEEVQEKMKKTALESVARHEKSLHKFKLAQSKKVDSDSNQSDSDLEILAQKKKKKAKKKKLKAAKVSKKKSKAQKVKIVEESDSDSSNSDSSDDKSSSDSSSSSPPPKKSKSSKKKKKEDSGMKLGGQQQPNFFPYPHSAAPAQPVMMMMPNMSGEDTNMGFINQFGQPVNMIKIEMPGPDGKMMKFFQMPTMTQGAMPPMVMPVSAMQQQVPQAVRQSIPQPVPAPTVQSSVPAVANVEVKQTSNDGAAVSSNLKHASIQDDLNEFEQADSSQESKDLSEKQKRRKEVIRTRLWPRPATTNWNAKENEETSAKQAEDSTEKAVDHIPGSSPSSQNQTDNTEMHGHKIPTLGSSDHYANATNTEQEADSIVVEEEEVHFDEPYNQEPPAASSIPTIAPAPIAQTGLVAYPQIVQGFKPVFSNPTAAVVIKPDSRFDASHSGKQEQQWPSTFNRSYSSREKLHSSEGECSSSSDGMEQYSKGKRGSESKKQGKYKASKDKTSDEEVKRGKKKKKNKKERKLSAPPEEPSSPVLKDKKRKKKKKSKVKDVAEDLSDAEPKLKRSQKTIDDYEVSKKKKKDGLERNIPQELPLSHIRGLLLRKQNEGGRSIFSHIVFPKIKKSAKSLREAHDTYEDQFVSLFHEESTEPAESPLTMTRSALKKIKIKPQGTRSVTHMTKMSLCERISVRAEEKQKLSSSQKVSVDFTSISSFESKFDKVKERSPSRSPSRSSRSPSKSPSKSRSSKSFSKSKSPRKYRSRSASRSSYSSRSRSRSLPKAYSVNDDRQHDDRRIYRRDGNRFQNNYQQNQHQNFRYNPQYRNQNRNRGFNNYNNRGNRGNYYNNRGNYYNNNRGYFNRNRGYYNNNNRDRQQWRPNYNRDRRDSDRGDRSFERRSYTRSPERENRGSSYSSAASDRRSADRSDYSKSDNMEGKGDARNVIESKHAMKSVKSPGQWTHDKYEEQDEDMKTTETE